MSAKVIPFVIVPTILHEGRYRLYEKPDGGLHLAYKRDDVEELQHMEIPGALINLARMAAEGNISPTQMLREMMKMRNEHLRTTRAKNCIGIAGSSSIRQNR